jgi:zinc protease
LTSLSNAWIDETNPENVLSFEKRLDALTVNDLQEAVKKYFDNKNYVKVVLYPENAKVKEGIIKKQM